MLAFLLATCAQALNPAALAREALVEYRANEERIAPDKVLARVLRNNQCTDSERRAAAESFLGTAARLRRYEWLCRDIRGDSEEVAAALLRARDEDAKEVAATLLRARDEDRTTTEWPSDPDERLSVESGAPMFGGGRAVRTPRDASTASIEASSRTRNVTGPRLVDANATARAASFPRSRRHRAQSQSGAPLSTLSRSFGSEGHSVVVRSSSLARSRVAATSSASSSRARSNAAATSSLSPCMSLQSHS